MSNTHTAEPGMLEETEKTAVRTKQPLPPPFGPVRLFISVPVGGRGEEAQDDVAPLHVDDVAGGVQEVEVEVRVSRH